MEPPRDGKLLATYMHAVENAQAGRWLQSADDYLQAYMMPSCAKWNAYYHVLSGFTSIIRDNRFPATQTHMRALKQIARDESRPVLHRAQAHFTRGLARRDAGDRQGAARDYMACIEVVAQATEADRATCFFNTTPDGGIHEVVGKELDRIAKDAHANLSNLRNPSRRMSPESLARAMATSEIRGSQNSIHIMGGGVGPCGDHEENTAKLEAAMARLPVNGDKCDQCGAKPDSTEVKLRWCGRCSMACYCSPECAKVAWKAGHKQACRAPGQYEVGDLVMVSGLASKPELNGKIVEVCGPAPGNTGRIATAAIGGV